MNESIKCPKCDTEMLNIGECIKWCPECGTAIWPELSDLDQNEFPPRIFIPNCFLKESKMFKLYYHVQNCGDGSASVKFHATEKQAIEADENQNEGWGESSVGFVVLDILN